MRVLPTLLGVLILIAGLLALAHTRPLDVSRPAPVTLEPLPTAPFRAVLSYQTDGEVRARDVTLRAAATPPARLAATLRALRTWLMSEGAWPQNLGAPRVFWLGEVSGESRAALDFPLSGRVDVPVTAELWLLESIRQTAARQGITNTFVMVGGQVPQTFLGQVSLPQTLGSVPMALEGSAASEVTGELTAKNPD